MSLGLTHWGKAGKRAVFALAFVALLFNVLAPPGYMLAGQAAGRTISVVLCTAQGPVAVAPDHGQIPTHKPSSDMPCAFAGHGVGAAPPVSVLVGLAGLAVYRRPVALAASDLAPGRGLAAPPPPSQGPPLLL
jgi:hypothetical protein